MQVRTNSKTIQPQIKVEALMKLNIANCFAVLNKNAPSLLTVSQPNQRIQAKLIKVWLILPQNNV